MYRFEDYRVYGLGIHGLGSEFWLSSIVSDFAL